MTAFVGTRRAALAQALLVTFLWSTSWVLIKIGLDDLDLQPLSFAGLRYVLAALVLLPLAVPALRALPAHAGRRGLFGRVLLLGLVLYAVTQGAQFAALVHLPSVAVALMLSTTPVVIALTGLRGGEPAGRLQLAGAIAVVAGAALYFGPLELGGGAAIGLLIAAVGVAANAASAVLGRAIARDVLPAVGGVMGMTALSMAAGSIVLLGVGLAVEGPPALTFEAWLIVGWLALVNTAFAFTLWNHTLRTLTAVESSVMNNMMLIQIAILAWIFLGEALDVRQLAGLAVALSGIVAVQLPSAYRRRGRAHSLSTMADELPECRVVLVGMMGSGKSTVGWALARRTGWPYHDNDTLLETALGLTAREVLSTSGESAMRSAESDALSFGLRQPAPCIVGAPAGTILEESSRDAMRSGALVIWLRARPETLAQRAVGAEHRPWLEGDAVRWMADTLDQRGPLYEATADFIVDTDTSLPDEVARQIASWLDGVAACRE